MYLDCSQLSDTSFAADVCIVGGGIAGIVIGLELRRRGLSVCILEGGGRRSSHRSQILYQGKSEDGRYDLAATRTRFLGGSSNCWGGWTRPFSPLDFMRRPWLSELDWPIGPETIAPYLAEACVYLQVAEPESDEAIRDRMEAEYGPFVEDLGDGRLQSIFFRMSPPTRFRRVYGDLLGEDPRIRVLLNATAVEILTSPDGATARGVRARSERGALTVQARFVVLAAGGVENPRLLLASRAARPAGIGNAHDLVGRYFMDHPRVRAAHIRLRQPERLSKLYDFAHYKGGSLLLRRKATGAALVLSEAEQERAGLLQSYTGLSARHAGVGLSTTQDAVELAKALVGRIHERVDRGRLMRTLRTSPSVGMSLIYRVIGLQSAHGPFELETVLEPWPDRENRVVLTDEPDRFGVPKVHVRWRRSDIERRTHRRAVEVIQEVLTQRGDGEVVVEDAAWEDSWDHRVMTTWHHMGTTRMASTPRQGVVDTDCRVFGMPNLYVAGSSVFPTGGGSPPTLMIVALALRLATHIGAQSLAGTGPDLRQAEEAAPAAL